MIRRQGTKKNGLSHTLHLQYPASKCHLPEPIRPLSTGNNPIPQVIISNTKVPVGNEVQINVDRQNEKTTLLVKHQQHLSLPKSDIQVFDRSLLHFHTFLRAFENPIESKMLRHFTFTAYFLEVVWLHWMKCGTCLKWIGQLTLQAKRLVAKNCEIQERRSQGLHSTILCILLKGKWEFCVTLYSGTFKMYHRELIKAWIKLSWKLDQDQREVASPPPWFLLRRILKLREVDRKRRNDLIRKESLNVLWRGAHFGVLPSVGRLDSSREDHLY